VSWHPAIEAAERAVIDRCRRLGENESEARAIVRAELSFDAEMEIMRDVRDIASLHEIRPGHGPMTIRGVSYYLVRSLPEPGWRVLP
jgi:hypothetical protein